MMFDRALEIVGGACIVLLFFFYILFAVAAIKCIEGDGHEKVFWKADQ